MNFKDLFSELKRRNVIKSTLAYLVIAWIIIQVANTVLPTFGAPIYFEKTIIFILAIGLPLWLIFSWVYELTPEGIKKTDVVKTNDSITHKTSTKLNKIIIGSLMVAIVLLVLNLFSDNGARASDEYSNSIAVLAFADMSPENDQEYFSDGVSEEILNLLAKIPSLKVISRTSSFSYKGNDQDIKKIGRELQVAYVLEGSIRKSGMTFRITAQLIRSDDGSHIWSETYDREMEDIFTIQDDIAEEVTNKLKVTLLGEELVSKKINTEAYNLYLRARALSYNATAEDNELAIELLNKAIVIDSSYVPARVLLNTSYYRSVTNFGIRPQSFFDSVYVMSKLAHEMDKKSSEALAGLAYSYLIKGDNEKALNYTKQALNLNSNDSKSVNIYGLLLRNNGAIDKALHQFEKVAELDPIRVNVYGYNLGTCYQLLRMIPEAVVNYNKVLELKKDDVITLMQLAECEVIADNKDAALSYVNRFVTKSENARTLNRGATLLSMAGFMDQAMLFYEKVIIHPDFELRSYPETGVGLSYNYLKNNKPDEAKALLDETFNSLYQVYGEDSDYYEYYWYLAEIACLRGNKEDALNYIEKLIEAGFVQYDLTLRDPYLNLIHNDSTFKKMMKGLEEKVGLMRSSLTTQMSITQN